MRTTVGVRSHLVTLSAPAASITSGTPVSLLTCATAGPSWPHSGPTMKCTFSWQHEAARLRERLIGIAGRIPVTISILRPPAVMSTCSQNSWKPSTMSAPGDASGPVSGSRKPILIGPCPAAQTMSCRSAVATNAAPAAPMTTPTRSLRA